MEIRKGSVKMFYKNVWYSEPEMIAYCDRLNEQNKALKAKLNSLYVEHLDDNRRKFEIVIIHDYLVKCHNDYTEQINSRTKRIYLNTAKHEKAKTDYEKYALELLNERENKAIKYYKGIIMFLSGTIELLEKELNSYEKDKDENND